VLGVFFVGELSGLLVYLIDNITNVML
jgi:hypothetical protein